LPIPTTSFVIPCYNLAHLLRECVSSILAQSYAQFEILILDDCSPDNTAEVASSFHDPRIRHIRNEKNLGHLQNYNRGIGLARGEYIWLISADDRLRSPHILERYVKIMNAYPKIGYSCCPAISLFKGEEKQVEGSISARDIIFSGKAFAKRLLMQGNLVIAASGMVRRNCYEKLGAFPLDLPYAGDWFLWCLFALHHDVAYFCEPMVNYRQHELSMTNRLTGDQFAIRFKDGLAVLWRIRREAEALGYHDLVKLCRQRIAYQYAHNILGRTLGASTYSMTVEEFENALQNDTSDPSEADTIRARTWEIIADSCFRRRDFVLAQGHYARSCTYRGSRLMASTKKLLLTLGAGPLVVNLKDNADAVRRVITTGDI
jgi:glycosyltransferase involved in cell wall biosynthesis